MLRIPLKNFMLSFTLSTGNILQKCNNTEPLLQRKYYYLSFWQFFPKRRHGGNKKSALEMETSSRTLYVQTSAQNLMKPDVQ